MRYVTYGLERYKKDYRHLTKLKKRNWGRVSDDSSSSLDTTTDMCFGKEGQRLVDGFNMLEGGDV